MAKIHSWGHSHSCLLSMMVSSVFFLCSPCLLSVVPLPRSLQRGDANGPFILFNASAHRRHTQTFVYKDGIHQIARFQCKSMAIFNKPYASKVLCGMYTITSYGKVNIGAMGTCNWCRGWAVVAVEPLHNFITSNPW